MKRWLGVGALLGSLLGFWLLAPVAAQAACTGNACFWVGGTGTWDTTNTGGGGTGGIKWATATGGTTGAGVPGSTDSVTFDANSGGGTVTIAGTGAGSTISIQSFTCTNYTGTIDFSINNNNLNIAGGTGFSCAGANPHLSLGSGTFTVSQAASSFNAPTTTANFNAGTSTISFTANHCGNSFSGAGNTFNAVTIACTNGIISVAGSNTIGTLTINPGNAINLGGATTQTVTTLNATGTSASPIGFTGANTTTQNLINSAGNQTLNWVYLNQMGFGGAGTWTANNSLKAGNTSGITVNPPSGGGSIGIIGG